MIERPTPETVRSDGAFVYMVREREKIRLAREAGEPAPWTEDPILARHRFTNVRRRHDRMSRWFIEHLIEPGLQRKQLWFTLLVARMINWPPTIASLLEHGVLPCGPETFDLSRFVQALESRKVARQQIYGGAYMLYPTKLAVGGVKSESVGRYVIGDVIFWADNIARELWREDQPRSVERFVKVLGSCFGVGPFIAGQVAADLTYAAGHLDEASDLYTYAPQGPGSLRGLNTLRGFRPGHAWTQAEFNAELISMRAKLINADPSLSDLTLHDVQNCACEYSKYARAVLGLGKPKSVYKPQTEY